jgi:hypothetical protein
VEAIISGHVDHRKTERDSNPKRFNVKKTLAERCVQKPVPEIRENSDGSNYINQLIDPIGNSNFSSFFFK